jgi:penicillin-binding protein 1A
LAKRAKTKKRSDADEPERVAAPPKRGKKKKRSSLSFGRLIYWCAVLCLWGVIVGVGGLVWIGMHLPALQSLEVPQRPPTTQILDINGKLLATRGEMPGANIALKDLPDYVPKAFIAIEDRRFYAHHGVDPIGLLRAVIANITHRGLSQGGSTLTQQLAKNLFLTQERTLHRKLQEVVLAFWLEHKFSKNEILELYLNRVYFGSGAYGVEAASQRYFGKSAKQINVAEAALLAGLVKSPSKLAPTRNFDAAERRAQIVLAAMADAGFIKDQVASAAMTKPPRIVQPSAGGSINYVADWVMDVLNDVIGKINEDIVVETTIDPTVQSAAEKALVETLDAKGAKFDVGQGAFVAMRPDGAVRALVGGRNYNDSQFNRAVAAKRQPGSAFKPFVYLTALEAGLTPDTIREDKPINVKGWKPENYTHQYFGPVTLTQALANSLNTVSVRLTLEVGPANVTKTAYRLGITSQLEPNASIALGTSEVSPLELVSAYAAFANGGYAITPHVVQRVRSGAGKVLYGFSDATMGRVIDPAYVAMMNRMMRETVVSGTARKAELPGWTPAGKTGTSQDFRDAWFIGYTNELVAGVWLGNDDSSPMKKATGGGLPVEIWNQFMRVALQGKAPSELPGASGAPLAMPAPTAPTMPTVAAPTTVPLPVSARPFQEPPPQVAASHSASSQPVRPQADRGLDGWLLDRLFR